jgi:glycosyltransferase involved in cell wall biosynthesis
MKVLLSAFQCDPGKGSELGKAWHWATALADEGHQITVLTESRFRENIAAGGRDDIEFQFVAPSGTPPTAPRVIRTYNYYMRWQDAAIDHMLESREHYDVVHHIAWGSLHLGSRLWRLPAPFIYGPIGGGQTAPANYWRYFGRNWPIEATRSAATGRLLEFNKRSRETLRNADVVLVTNFETEAAAKRLGAGDVRYFLSEGLRTDWINTPRQRPTGVPIVLWVGRFLPRKAPTLAIEAFSELRKTMPARLIMAGDGPSLEKARAKVSQLGLGADVDLPGRVPWTQVPELCDSASVFLFTSLRDSSGAQFLEAMGRGLPAVALDHHGIGDVKVGQAAEKVALPRRPEELHLRIADALRTVLSGDDWEARSAEAVSWASGNTWSIKAAAATRIYDEVTKRLESGAGARRAPTDGR